MTSKRVLFAPPLAGRRGRRTPVGNHLFTLRLRLDGGFIAKAAQWPRLGLVTELTSFFSSGYVSRPLPSRATTEDGAQLGWGPATQEAPVGLIHADRG